MALPDQCPRACEYNDAIQIVLETCTTDVAESVVLYGVHNGFDAWRKLCNHHVPLAEDLQQISIQELLFEPDTTLGIFLGSRGIPLVLYCGV